VVGDRAVGVGIEPGLVDQDPDPVRVEPAGLPRQEAIGVVGSGQVELARLVGGQPAEVDRDPLVADQPPGAGEPVGRSSTSPGRDRAASWDRARAAASSVGANSAISGVPAPAMGTARSPHAAARRSGSLHEAAWSSSVVTCALAHPNADSSTATSAARLALIASRASANSPTLEVGTGAAVAVIPHTIEHAFE